MAARLRRDRALVRRGSLLGRQRGGATRDRHAQARVRQQHGVVPRPARAHEDAAQGRDARAARGEPARAVRRPVRRGALVGPRGGAARRRLRDACSRRARGPTTVARARSCSRVTDNKPRIIAAAGAGRRQRRELAGIDGDDRGRRRGPALRRPAVQGGDPSARRPTSRPRASSARAASGRGSAPGSRTSRCGSIRRPHSVRTRSSRGTSFAPCERSAPASRRRPRARRGLLRVGDLPRAATARPHATRRHRPRPAGDRDARSRRDRLPGRRSHAHAVGGAARSRQLPPSP